MHFKYWTDDPISVLSLKHASRIFYKIRQLPRSISYLTDALEMEPGDFETLLLLGVAYAELKEYPKR